MSERTDTERLDWLAENFEQHSFRYVKGWPRMDNSAPPYWSFWAYKEGTTKRPTLREAVDAAMDQNPATEHLTKERV